MIARYAGACLGLLAFGLVILAGLAVHNPPMVTLSRAVWALVVFCALGVVLGLVAQAVICEHARQRREAQASPEPPSQMENLAIAEPKDADGSAAAVGTL